MPLGPTCGALWSIRMAPLLRSREASPVRTRSESTMDSSASMMIPEDEELEDADDDDRLRGGF